MKSPPQIAAARRERGESMERDERADALSEASNVIAALSSSSASLPSDLVGGESETDLDSFNLLGVVTNPYMPTSIASMPSSSHGYSSRHPHLPSPSSHASSSAADPNSVDSLMALPDLPSLDISSVISPQLEGTLQSATDTIDNLNAIFDYYSRHYLGTLYNEDDHPHMLHGASAHLHTHAHLTTSAHDYSPELAHNEQPSSLLPELPLELSTLDLTGVEHHLRTCGNMTANFLRRYEADLEEEKHLKMRAAQNKKLLKAAPVQDGAGKTMEDNEIEEEEMQQVDLITNVPEIFFSPYFDLTDPKTFQSLLVLDDNEEDDDGKEQKEEESQNEEKQEETSPISQIIRLPNPSTLTSHLDEIELNLLEQVRSKSSSFFRETTRFSTLKSLIATSVSDVITLRSDIQSLQIKLISDVECIPNMDTQRTELEILGKVCDMVTCVSECKNSIAGLMAGGDYLGAVEAIFVARNLLHGKQSLVHDDDDTDSDDDEYNEQDEKKNKAKTVQLGKLRALSKVSEQLQQYEELAVMRLTNELVDIFLNWNNNTASSTLASSSNLDTIDSKDDTTSFPVVSHSQQQANVRTRVKDIVSALRTCCKLDSAAKAYKDKLCEVVKVTVRTTVTECAADISTSASGGSKNSSGGKGSKTNGGVTVNATSKEEKKDSGGNIPSTTPTTAGKSSITAGVTSMSFPQFLNCLDMLLEQVLVLLRGAVGVHKFLREEDILLKDVVLTETGGSESSEENASNSGGEEPPPPPPSTPSTPLRSTTNESNTTTTTTTALSASSELAHKSVSELLRLRKDSHSLITFDEMKTLWDTSLAFVLQLEKYSGRKAYNLRGTLLAQAKAFVERKHESNMSALVAALDGERWTQCDVSAERQAALTRLCSGRAVLSTTKITARRGSTSTTDTTTTSTATTSSSSSATSAKKNKMSDAEVEGKRYKVVWSCLLLVEMIMSNVACAAHFQTLATNVVGKVVELLRLFNSRSTHLVLMAGAIHSAARLKSINAKHLALVTQCLGLVIAILPHVRAALMAQLPSKQHTLLVDLDRVKKEYADHNEKVLSKFVSIIGGIVEHALAPRIGKTDFDARAKKFGAAAGDGNNVTCTPFLEGISSNTKKMHQVLGVLLPEEHLQDVFSRIFAYVDSKVPSLFIAAAAAASSSEDGGGGGSSSSAKFSMPQTEEGKRRMVLEVEAMSNALNSLSGVQAWDFSAMKVLEKKLDINMNPEEEDEATEEEKAEQDEEEEVKDEEPKSEAEDTTSDKADETDSDVKTNGEANGKGDYGGKDHKEEEDKDDSADANGVDNPEGKESSTVDVKDTANDDNDDYDGSSAEEINENENTAPVASAVEQTVSDAEEKDDGGVNGLTEEKEQSLREEEEAEKGQSKDDSEINGNET